MADTIERTNTSPGAGSGSLSSLTSTWRGPMKYSERRFTTLQFQLAAHQCNYWGLEIVQIGRSFRSSASSSLHRSPS